MGVSSELLVPAGEFVLWDSLVPGIFVKVGGVRRALNLRQDGRSQAPSLQAVPVKTLKTRRDIQIRSEEIKLLEALQSSLGRGVD